jgi:hypothetical protein
MMLSTALIFGYIARRLREHWAKRPFWAAIAVLTAVHLLVFYAAVNTGAFWSVGFYVIVFIVEVPVLLTVLALVLNAKQTDG